MADATPDDDLDDTLALTTADQLAAEHDMLRGSASLHLKVLSCAGLVRVVRTIALYRTTTAARAGSDAPPDPA